MIEFEEIKEQTQNLENHLDQMLSEEKNLRASIETGQLQVERAQKLLVSLASEGEKWKILHQEYQIDLNNSIGNSILSSSIIGYMGQFNLVYR